MKAQKESPAAFRWEVGIPILTNRFIMTQVAFALGIPALVVGGIVLAVSMADGGIPQEPSNDWMYIIILIALVLGLTTLLIIAIYGNRFYAVFEIDEKGIRQYPMKKTAKKNTVMNAILFFAGLASGKPGYAGTALIAQSTNSASIQWKNVGKLKLYPGQKAIAVKNGWRTVLVIYCTRENYHEISEFMHSKFKSSNK